MEWIEDGDPHGVEILEKVVQCPTPYRVLLRSAIDEYNAYRQRIMEETDEGMKIYKPREEKVLKEIDFFLKSNKEGAEKNRNLRINIQLAKNTLQSTTRDCSRLSRMLEADKRKLDPAWKKTPDDFVDQKDATLEFRIDLYTKERERLEKMLEEKEEKLAEVTKVYNNLMQNLFHIDKKENFLL